MLMVAAAVAGEPLGASAAQAAGAAGHGLGGLIDPNSVGASGEVGENDRIGDEVLDSVDGIDDLLELGPNPGIPTGSLGVSGIMMEAYINAADKLAAMQPNCNLHWSVLAAIGKVESGHARGGKVDAKGNTTPNILGPQLNGGGFAAISDTDNGALDGDSRWDRAVGAMQFIPSTWAGYAADGNGDGIASPHNVFDATVAAGKYLCSGGLNLDNEADLYTAIFRYNHSNSYVFTVLNWADAYANGTSPLEGDDYDYDPGNDALGPQLPPLPPPGTPPPPPPPPPGPTPPPGTHPSTTPKPPTGTTIPRPPTSTTPCTPTTEPSTTTEESPVPPSESTTPTTATTTETTTATTTEPTRTTPNC
jgi:hypothetical protein